MLWAQPPITNKIKKCIQFIGNLSSYWLQWFEFILPVKIYQTVVCDALHEMIFLKAVIIVLKCQYHSNTDILSISQFMMEG